MQVRRLENYKVFRIYVDGIQRKSLNAGTCYDVLDISLDHAIQVAKQKAKNGGYKNITARLGLTNNESDMMDGLRAYEILIDRELLEDIVRRYS